MTFADTPIHQEPERLPGPDLRLLNADPQWQLLWTSPASPLYQRIESLEAQLHSTQPLSHEALIGLRHEIASLRWLRDVVAAASKLDAQPQAAQPPKTRVDRLRTMFGTVLNSSLG